MHTDAHITTKNGRSTMRRKSVTKAAPAAAKKTPATKKPLKAATTQQSVVIQIDSPVWTQEKYVEKTGLVEGVVRGHVDKKLVPTIKIGRHRMINMALLTKQCLEADTNA